MRSIHTTNQQDHKNNTPYRVIHKHRTKLGNPIRGIILPVTSIITLSAILLAGASTTYAEGSSVSLSVDNSDTVLELTVPESVSLDLTPSSTNNYNPSGTASLSVSAGTNNITGYTLTMSVPSTNLVNSNVTLSSSNNPNHIPLDNDNHPIIPTITSTYSGSNFPDNAWGYRLSTSANYSPVPSSIELASTNSAGNATTTTLELIAKVNAIQPAGTYTTTFNIAATAKQSIFTANWNANGGTVSPTTSTYRYGSQIGTLPEPTYTGYNFLGWFTQATGGEQISETTTVTADVTYWAHWEKAVYDCRRDSSIASNYTMQNIANLKSSAFATQGTQVKLCDTRDGKAYYAAKQADGNIWMTQNLDLDLDATVTYKHADTDLGWTDGNTTATWTPGEGITYPDGQSANTIVGTAYGSSTWTNNYNSPYSWDPGHYQILDSYSISSACTNKDFSQCTNGVTPATSEGEANHYHVGNLYNWSAAVANNDTSAKTTRYEIMPNSICPAGWKLPNALPKASSAGMFSTLLFKAGIITAEYTGTSLATWSTDGKTLIFQDPLYLVRGGYEYSGSVYGVGTYGYYWSSSVSSSDYAYHLYFRSSDIRPQYNNSRGSGSSVRCVAR